MLSLFLFFISCGIIGCSNTTTGNENKTESYNKNDKEESYNIVPIIVTGPKEYNINPPPTVYDLRDLALPATVPGYTEELPRKREGIFLPGFLWDRVDNWKEVSSFPWTPPKDGPFDPNRWPDGSPTPSTLRT